MVEGSGGAGGDRPAHVPVMRERVLALLSPSLTAPDAVLVDATVGLGGHARALLDAHPHARLVGIDRDTAALERAAARLAAHADRITLVHAVYDQIPAVLARLGLRRVQAVLLDLGVSSLQLDDDSRGFAYARDGALDMRMDATTGVTAADILNEYSAADLARVLRVYGEERYARRIADAVVRERAHRPFTRSDQLVDVVRASIPAPARRTGGNPAKRTFQALRIEVNGEFGALERALPAALAALAVAGRIVVLAYHSLEDRMVKHALADQARPGGPIGLPVTLPEHEPRLRLLTRGAERPADDEVAANPRAASARLRAAECLREAA